MTHFAALALYQGMMENIPAMFLDGQTSRNAMDYGVVGFEFSRTKRISETVFLHNDNHAPSGHEIMTHKVQEGMLHDYAGLLWPLIEDWRNALWSVSPQIGDRHIDMTLYFNPLSVEMKLPSNIFDWDDEILTHIFRMNDDLNKDRFLSMLSFLATPHTLSKGPRWNIHYHRNIGSLKSSKGRIQNRFFQAENVQDAIVLNSLMEEGSVIESITLDLKFDDTLALVNETIAEHCQT